jgi:hypothetical protein
MKLRNKKCSLRNCLNSIKKTEAMVANSRTLLKIIFNSLKLNKFEFYEFFFYFFKIMYLFKVT